MPKAQRVVFATHTNEWIERFADAFMNVQEVIEIEEEEEDETETEE
jgi:flagellar biosynthesis component FlhA